MFYILQTLTFCKENTFCALRRTVRELTFLFFFGGGGRILGQASCPPGAAE